MQEIALDEICHLMAGFRITPAAGGNKRPSVDFPECDFPESSLAKQKPSPSNRGTKRARVLDYSTAFAEWYTENFPQ